MIQALSEPQNYLSQFNFSEAAFEKFMQADTDIMAEKMVAILAISIIEEEIKNTRCVWRNILCKPWSLNRLYI